MIQKIRKAQSIVEYLLVFAAIVLAVLFGSKIMGDSTRGQMNSTKTNVDSVSDRLATQMDTTATKFN